MKKTFQGWDNFISKHTKEGVMKVLNIMNVYNENYIKLYTKVFGFGNVEIIGGKDMGFLIEWLGTKTLMEIPKRKGEEEQEISVESIFRRGLL